MLHPLATTDSMLNLSNWFGFQINYEFQQKLNIFKFLQDKNILFLFHIIASSIIYFRYKYLNKVKQEIKFDNCGMKCDNKQVTNNA